MMQVLFFLLIMSFSAMANMPKKVVSLPGLPNKMEVWNQMQAVCKHIDTARGFAKFRYRMRCEFGGDLYITEGYMADNSKVNSVIIKINGKDYLVKGSFTLGDIQFWDSKDKDRLTRAISAQHGLNYSFDYSDLEALSYHVPVDEPFSKDVSGKGKSPVGGKNTWCTYSLIAGNQKVVKAWDTFQYGPRTCVTDRPLCIAKNMQCYTNLNDAGGGMLDLGWGRATALVVPCYANNGKCPNQATPCFLDKRADAIIDRCTDPSYDIPPPTLPSSRSGRKKGAVQ